MQKLGELLDPIRDKIRIKRQMAPPEYVGDTAPREFIEECECVLIEDPDTPTWTYTIPNTGEVVPVRVIKLCDHHRKHPEVTSIGGYVLNWQAEEALQAFREIPEPREADVVVDWIKGTRTKAGYYKAKIGRVFCKGETFNEAAQKLIQKLKERDGTNFDFRIVAGTEKRRPAPRLVKALKTTDDSFPWF